MRITAGTYRGRVLASVDDGSVRPAMDRIRASIFNILQNRLRIEDARVLDLFAGTGSLGFEALSRGARECVFVDSGRATLAVIEKNARTLACEDRCDLIAGDALDVLRKLPGGFSLIFADPPYAYAGIGELPSAIMASGLLSPDGLLVIEHARKVSFAPHPSYAIAVQKQYGNTSLTMFCHPSREKEQP